MAGDTAGDSERSPDSALKKRSAGGSFESFEFLSGGFLGLLMLASDASRCDLYAAKDDVPCLGSERRAPEAFSEACSGVAELEAAPRRLGCCSQGS